MKIGILTHHYVKNYGAFLQMKGMYETLQRLYPEAEVTVINYVNQKHWRRNIIHILHFRPGVDTLSTYVEKIRQLRTFTKYERSIPRTRPVKTAKEIIDLKLDLIVLGKVETITARHGEVLQLRPKAANSRALTEAIGEKGQPIMTLPRGFYLKKTFTGPMLARHFLL